MSPAPIPGRVFDSLHPGEQQYARNLPADRRREWIAGRHCLAEALKAVSAPRIPLMPSPPGGPYVPSGFAGSISHKGPFTVAVATDEQVLMGVDVECSRPMDAKLAGKVLTAGEFRRFAFAALTPQDAGHFVVIHLAIKEAIFKATRPDQQLTLQFSDIEANVDPELLDAQRLWVGVDATVSGVGTAVRAVIFLEQTWALAIARRPATSPDR